MMKIRIRASVLCLDKGKLLVVSLRDPVTHQAYRLPPGGMVEKGEKPRTAALRELREETGYDAELEKGFEQIVDYPFVWGGQTHACRTHFFRGQVKGTRKRVSAEETVLEGCDWIAVDTLAQEWAFHPQLRDALIAALRNEPAKSAKPVRKKT